MPQCDFLIIGGGPAGLAAALFGRRKHLETVLLERSDSFGGHLWHSYGAKSVLDFPGFPEGIVGHDLVNRFVTHARQEGAELLLNKTVESIERRDEGFLVHTAEGEDFPARSLLIAIGTVPRRLGLEGERKYANKSLFYSLNSPRDFAGRCVLVIGGGNTALEVATGLRGVAAQVKLIHRSRFRADESLQEEFRAACVPYDLGFVLTGLNGDNKMDSVTIKCLDTGDETTMPTDAVIVCTGLSPAAGYLEELGLSLNERGFIVADQETQTNVPGIFAAGDITGSVARLATAVGQGVTAAHSAHRYLKNLEVKAPRT